MIEKMKENLCLDEMREMVWGKMKDVRMRGDELVDKGLV